MSTATILLGLSRRSPRRMSLSSTCCVLSAVLLASAVAATAQAAPKKQSRSARSEPAESGPRLSKVAVFAFDGDEATNVRKHVVMALANQGLKVDTSLRPVQTAEEFRDMGATLDLAAYVHGRIKDLPADKAEATIMVRSGVTGRTIASTTITGYRRGLRFDVEEKLWQRVGKVLLRVCKEAKRPRRPVNAPTRIEAGTPL
jgi:hypothetical protein